MFLTELDCRLIPGRNEIQVNGALRYYSERFGLFILPDHGFICDLASTPQITWSVTGIHPFDYRIREGAVIHDWGYSGRSDTGLTRKQWDKVLFDCCVEKGMSPEMAKAVYLAVRVGGGQFYKGEN